MEQINVSKLKNSFQEVTLGWNDEQKRDFLVELDKKPFREVMNARARGTTVYELIDIYGGVDNVTEAMSSKAEKAVFGDAHNMPEFANDESFQALAEAIKETVMQSLQTQTKKEDPQEEKQLQEPIQGENK